jgi:hypothetical protein
MVLSRDITVPLFQYARFIGFSNDVILVNFEAVPRYLSSLDPRLEETMTAAEWATLSVEKVYLDYLSTVTAWSGQDMKSAEEARQVKFVYISMKTYLAEYDWKGELTEEQVRPWLEQGVEAKKKDSDQIDNENLEAGA